MKFNKIIIGLAAICVLEIAPCARAQSDAVAANAPLILANAGTIAGVAQQNTFTNNPVWLSGYYGKGEIYFISSTNAGGTLTATVETSPDTTNWTGIPTYSLAANYTQIWTNTYYGSTNLFATNTWVLNYTPTAATPATAGYVSTYAAVTGTLQNTNTGAVTITKAGIYKIGLSLPTDVYAHVIWTATGAATNVSTVVGSFMTGPRLTRPGVN
jgi:hypothetical protein